MSDTIWQALADAYIKGAQGVHDDHAKVIDWKAEAAPIGRRIAGRGTPIKGAKDTALSFTKVTLARHGTATNSQPSPCYWHCWKRRRQHERYRNILCRPLRQSL